MKSFDQEHLNKIRKRFTITADPFAVTVRSRAREVERLAEMVTADYPNLPRSRALDVCCGPGTFGRALAPRTGRVVGADFTPAMLAQARSISAEAGLGNIEFVCCDGNTLPFADGSFDFAICTFAFHHLLEPARVLGEMARVVRKGGRVAIVDAVMPERADRNLNTHIERLRDPSHAAMFTESGLRELLREGGLRVIASNLNSRDRDFDDWMFGAGWAPSTPTYADVRREIEATMADDAAGFAPRLDSGSGALMVTQAALSLVATKD